MKGASAPEAFFIGIALVVTACTFALYILYYSHTSSAQCGLSMSLDGQALVVESPKPAAYKISINGTLVWPCPECVERGRLAVPLGWQFAEVEVLRQGKWRLYVVRLPNGTYAFAWDGKMARSVCIP